MRLVIDGEEIKQKPKKTKPPAPPSIEVLPSLVSKSIATTSSVKGFAEKLRPIVDIKTRKHEQKIMQNEHTLRMYKAEIVQAKRDIERAKERILNKKELVKRGTEELKKIKQEKPPRVAVEPIVARLRKHKALQYAKVLPDGTLWLYFKPLWTEAQFTEHGKETTGRMFIGCFVVTIKYGSSIPTIRIKNSTFPCLNYPHWTVSSSGTPCLGTWEDNVRELWAEGKLYDLVTLLTAYLESNLDSTGYSRTCRHRKARLECIDVLNVQVELSEPEPKIYAINLRSEGDTRGDSLLHLPVEVRVNKPFDDDFFGCIYLTDVQCNDYGYHKDNEQCRSWWIRRGNLHVIPKERINEVLEAVKTKTTEEVRELCAGIVESTEKGKIDGEHLPTGTNTQENELIEQKKRELREALVAQLDQSATLDYKTVAQKLVIDASKL